MTSNSRINKADISQVMRLSNLNLRRLPIEEPESDRRALAEGWLDSLMTFLQAKLISFTYTEAEGILAQIESVRSLPSRWEVMKEMLNFVASSPAFQQLDVAWPLYRLSQLIHEAAAGDLDNIDDAKALGIIQAYLETNKIPV